MIQTVYSNISFQAELQALEMKCYDVALLVLARIQNTEQSLYCTLDLYCLTIATNIVLYPLMLLFRI